jgi:NADPH:quinone reductase
MRAVAVPRLKAPPELMELPKPTPGEGEILVHLGNAGVNPYDWKIGDGVLEGRWPHEFPLILGVDGAGVVEGVGPGVTKFAVGDGVFGQFLHPPVGRGTYAEYVTAPEGIGLAPMPRGMYPAQGAAVPTAGMTALTALDELGLTKGQSLLIHGAGGGIGSYAVQLASNAGILTLAASRGPHRDFLHRLGASRFFDASAASFASDVKLAYPDGVDAVLDVMHAGPAFAEFLPLVKKGGVVASTIGQASEAVLAPLGLRGFNVSLEPKAELLERLGKEFSVGRIRIPVEETKTLADAPQVLEASRAGKIKGKTVLKI